MFSKYSVKKPYTVIVGIILVIVLGVISFQHMTTDLLPSMNLPYVVVYTPYVGATPEQVESEITRPMEAAFATLTDVKKITSSSRDNVSVVIMQFNDGANMDTALIELSSRLDQLKGGWDDAIGAPVSMKLNPDMLPVAILSVTRDDMDILALSDYVENELVPAFEALNGVASATASGVIEQRIDVTIEPSRIDVLNSAILEEVDAELADVERQLNDAQAQLTDGKRQLARAKEQTLNQINDALAAIDEGAQKIDPAIQQLRQQREELAAQRQQLADSVSALERMVNMDDTQRAALKLAQQQLAELKQQLADAQQRLAEAEAAGTGDATLDSQRADIIAQRDELNAQRASQQQYLNDLSLVDPDALRQEIAGLESSIAQREAALSEAQSAYSDMEARQAALAQEIDSLTAEIAQREAADGTTDETGDGTTDETGDGTTGETGDGTTGETGDGTTDEAGDGTTDGTGDGTTDETGDGTTDGTGDGTTDETGDGTTDETGDGTTDETGDGTADETGDSTTDETGGDPADGSTDETADGSTGEATDNTSEGQANDGGDSAVSAPESGEAEGDATGGDVPESDNTGSADGEADEASPDATGGEPAPLSGFLTRSALAEEEDIGALRTRLEAAQGSLSQLNQEAESKKGEIDALESELNADRATLADRKQALETLEGNNASVESRREEATRQIAALDLRIAALDQELAGLDQLATSLEDTPENLRQGIAQIQSQITELENSDAYKALALLDDPEGLNAQYAQAQAGLAQLDAGIAQIDASLDKLNKGIIPGGFIEGIDEDTKLSDARSQLEAAREQAESGFSKASSQLREGAAELAKARKEFNENRDEALKNAGLDGVITVQMVSGLIGAQNFSMPAGYVYDADNNQVLVRVGDKFDTLDALRRMKLFEMDLDSVDEVRLLDVASVELVDNRDEVFTKLNGSDGILLSFDKQSTYSTADVARTILDRAEALTQADPNLHIVDLMNQGEYINIIVDSVLNNLMSGGGLAILILLLFLMDFRPTITVAFSIPISVVIAFVCMYFSGITLNVLSLSGLSLGIGMLVDNSIVAIENIYRLHDEEKVPLLRACVEGVRSVSGALFSSTLTTICVFLPIVFVQGMARDLFADMGLTIAFSLLASLFVAMTVVPAMCSFLMRKSKPHKHRVFGAIQRLYGALLDGALRIKPLVLLAALGLLAFSAMQVPKMGISFMPEVNSRQMSADLAFAPEMTDAEQKEQAVAIMNDMLALPGVDSVGLMGGGGGMLSGLTGGSGMSYYIMIDESLGLKNADIARQMTEIGEKYHADLTVQASTMDISMMTGSGISVEITGDDIDTLQAIAMDVAELARQTEGVVDVDDGLEDAVPEMRILVDKEKAIEKGLTTAQVFQFIAQKAAGRIEITQVTLDGKELSIYLQDGENLDLGPEDLENLEIEVSGKEEDEMVRVGDIATVRQTRSLSTINRASQRRMVTVTFGVADGYSANLVSDDFKSRLDAYDVPTGYSASLAGENETVMGIMKDLVWMVLVAILLIFLIMVAQFQSFKSPIIVMFTIPLAFTGGLLALLLTGMDLSIVSMLGFLVLSGVVVNNGIVFIDCVNQLRIGGMEKREALLETGRMRLRPILMTALTTILGMSTMALGQGTGAEMMQPMAVVSIGGLTYATLMTLFVVPVLYDLFNGKTMKAREIMMIREASGMTGDEVLDGDDREGDSAPAEDGAPSGEDSAPAEDGAPSGEDSAPAEDGAPSGEDSAPAEGGGTPPVLSPDAFKYDPKPKAVRIRLGKR